MPHPLRHWCQHAPDSCWRQVKDERIQTGIESAEQESLVSPRRTAFGDESHHVRNVVGSKAEREHQQRAQGKSNGSKLPPSANVWQARQDANEVDVAESADEQRDAEEHNAQLQAYRQQNMQLGISKLLIAHVPRRRAYPRGVVVRHDVDDAKMEHGEHPEEDGGHHGVNGSTS